MTKSPLDSSLLVTSEGLLSSGLDTGTLTILLLLDIGGFQLSSVTSNEVMNTLLWTALGQTPKSRIANKNTQVS